MKHKILSLAAAAALALGLAACHDDCQPNETDNGKGSLSFASLSVDVSVAENVVRHAPAAEGSRAGVDVSDFLVVVKNAAGETEGSWTYSKMPEIISLPVATGYTVEVKSHEVQKAEWARPYYLGSKTFDIVEGQVTEIGAVVCKFASIKVSIKFDEALAAQLGADSKVNVLANDEGSLDFTPAETRSGYFAAVEGSSTLVATFTGTVGSSQEFIQRTFRDVAAGQHRIITFKIKGNTQEPDPETGNITIGGITVDMDVVSEDLNSNITVGEDNITSGNNPSEGEWPEDPDNPNKPDEPNPPVVDPGTPTITIESAGMSFDAPNNVADVTNGLVNIHSEKPITNLEVKIESTNGDFIASVGELMPTEFDLADPGEFTEALASIGLKVKDEVVGQNDVPFDITTLVPLLGAFPGEHKFTITVKDNAGGSLSKTLTFVTE